MTRPESRSRIDVLLEAITALGTDDQARRILDTVVHQGMTAMDADASGLVIADATGRLQVVAGLPSTTSALEIHELQHGEAPAGRSWARGESIWLDDLATLDADSPARPFANSAMALGMRSALTVPVLVLGHRLGALTFLWGRAHPASAEVERIARGAATLAGVALIAPALDSVRLGQEAQRAIADRVRLEQAKGMVAARRDITVDDAEALLRQRADADGTSIDDVARFIVERVLDARDLG